jgi:hypothetical protein
MSKLLSLLREVAALPRVSPSDSRLAEALLLDAGVEADMQAAERDRLAYHLSAARLIVDRAAMETGYLTNPAHALALLHPHEQERLYDLLKGDSDER